MRLKRVKTVSRERQAVAGDLLHDIQRGTVGGLRQRDGAGKAFGGDDEAAIGRGDQPAEVDADALGDFASDQRRRSPGPSPSSARRRPCSTMMVSEMADKGVGCQRRDLRQGSMHQRRGRQRVSRDQHDDHLKREGEECEDARVPGAAMLRIW